MRYFLFCLVLQFGSRKVYANQSLQVKNVYLPSGKLSFDLKTGTIDYTFDNGISLKNTIAYVDLVHHGIKVSAQLDRCHLKEEAISDGIGAGRLFQFIHDITLVQSIKVYENNPYLLFNVEASKEDKLHLETWHISSLAILEASCGNIGISWKHPIVVGSIMRSDVVFTLAISSMFPDQYAHTRFVLTNVYSHQWDSQQGFPRYGSLATSMINTSHMGRAQDMLWTYTKLVMGSVLGDGPDYRVELVRERAAKYLGNPEALCFFKGSKAFTPIKLARVKRWIRNFCLSLPSDTTLVVAFNFDEERIFDVSFPLSSLGVDKGHYQAEDFLTGEMIAELKRKDSELNYTVNPRDAVLLKLKKVN